MPQVTIKDVARHAGVSFQTVSLVINHPEKVAKRTREAVESSMRELAFVPSLAARSLRNIPSKSIACVFSTGAQPFDDRTPEVQETYQGFVLQTLAHVCDRHGYTLVHRQWRSDVPQSLAAVSNLVSESRVDGIIVLADRRDDPLVSILRARGSPFVVFGLDIPDVDYVTRADYSSLKTIVGFLQQTGCQRLAYLFGERKGYRSPASEARVQGFKDGLRDAGIDASDAILTPCDWTSESGYQETIKVLKGPKRPDAIVAANDRAAFGVLKALHDSGVSVPDEISVVGFDNFLQGRYAIPSLTSFTMPLHAMVELSFSILVQKVAQKNAMLPAIQRAFEGRLVLRDSTRRPNGPLTGDYLIEYSTAMRPEK